MGVKFNILENLRIRRVNKFKNCDLFLKDNPLNLNELLNDISNSKIIIYTAISGNYEILKDPEFIDENCDYVCFTDNPNIKSSIWKIVLMKNNNLDNNRKAKQYKVLPHNYFPDYKYSFWIDASLTIKGSIREYIKRYLKNEILCVLHPNYDDINDELKDSFFKLRYPKYILNKQVDYYKNKGLPPHFGMVLTGVLFRQHNNPKIIYLMELWWKEIIDYSTQCQISFPYVMWENDFHPSVSPINIFNNEYWFTSKKGNLHAIEEKSFLNSNNLLMNIEKNNFNYSLNNNDLHLIYNDLKILENIQIDDIEFSFWEAFKLKIKRLRIYFILWYVWNILKKSL